MPSILSQILDNKNFGKNLTEAIKSHQINERREAYDYVEDGSIEDGIIIIFDIISEFVFEDIDNNIEGLNVSMKVNFTGTATVEFVNSGGNTDHNEPSGHCRADISIILPPDTIALDNIDDIASKTEVEIIDIVDKLNTQSPNEIRQEEKNFRVTEICLMSEEDLRNEVKKLDKENSDLKKQITEFNN
jgi:hypothetical protein